MRMNPATSYLSHSRTRIRDEPGTPWLSRSRTRDPGRACDAATVAFENPVPGRALRRRGCRVRNLGAAGCDDRGVRAAGHPIKISANEVRLANLARSLQRGTSRTGGAGAHPSPDGSLMFRLKILAPLARDDRSVA